MDPVNPPKQTPHFSEEDSELLSGESSASWQGSEITKQEKPQASTIASSQPDSPESKIPLEKRDMAVVFLAKRPEILQPFAKPLTSALSKPSILRGRLKKRPGALLTLWTIRQPT